MILSKVKIQNFKSIKDTGWVYLSQGDLINILAGQNESGKTSFLRALNFFQEGLYDSFEEQDRRMEEYPRVDCTFQLNNEEYVELKDNSNKEIADYIKKNGFNFVRGDIQKDEFSMRYSYPDDLKSLIENYNKLLLIPTVEGQDPQIDPGQFDIFTYLNNLRPEMVFYSSFTNSILPGKISYTDINNNEAVKDFEKIYNISFQELLDTAKTNDSKRTREEERIRAEAAESLNTYWNQTISGEDVQYKFSISAKPDSDINKSYITFFINQGDEPQLMVSQKSQGFQWFMGFNLRLRAHEQDLKSNGLILLIDEPGQGLHEVAQSDVKEVLEELARDSNIQIIYSTHQPILLGGENIQFSRLLLVDRTKIEGSKFKTISQLVSSNGGKDSLSPIKSALGLISINSLPAASKILITEGITEYFYLKTLLPDDIVIIPSAGVDQIPNIFAILLGWGLSAKALVDDDTQGKKVFNKTKKEFYGNQDSIDFKKALLKIDGMNGIEDLLSEDIIKNILSQYNKNYISQKNKIDNIEQVGKFIFAKTFFDTYKNNPASLDIETKTNFKQIQNFIEG